MFLAGACATASHNPLLPTFKPHPGGMCNHVCLGDFKPWGWRDLNKPTARQKTRQEAAHAEERGSL